MKRLESILSKIQNRIKSFKCWILLSFLGLGCADSSALAEFGNDRYAFWQTTVWRSLCA